MNKIKCFLVWLLWGHSDTSEGKDVEMAQCTGCDKYVFKRK